MLCSAQNITRKQLCSKRCNPAVPVLHLHPCCRVGIQVGGLRDVQPRNLEGAQVDLRQRRVVHQVEEAGGAGDEGKDEDGVVGVSVTGWFL